MDDDEIGEACDDALKRMSGLLDKIAGAIPLEDRLQIMSSVIATAHSWQLMIVAKEAPEAALSMLRAFSSAMEREIYGAGATGEGVPEISFTLSNTPHQGTH